MTREREKNCPEERKDQRREKWGRQEARGKSFPATSVKMQRPRNVDILDSAILAETTSNFAQKEQKKTREFFTQMSSRRFTSNTGKKNGKKEVACPRAECDRVRMLLLPPPTPLTLPRSSPHGGSAGWRQLTTLPGSSTLLLSNLKAVEPQFSPGMICLFCSLSGFNHRCHSPDRLFLSPFSLS